MAKAHAAFLRASGGGTQTFDRPIPFLFRAAVPGHNSQAGVHGAADEVRAQFRRPVDALLQELHSVRAVGGIVS